jgi:hypothetical protein
VFLLSRHYGYPSCSVRDRPYQLFEQNIAYDGVLVYNKLPSEIKSIKSIIKFKMTLRNFLLEKSFYSVEEFMTVDFKFVGTGLKMYICIVIASAFFCVLC